MQTGWKFINGNWYYLESNGEMQTGWKFIDGNWYYLESSGLMAINTIIDGWNIGLDGIAKMIV